MTYDIVSTRRVGQPISLAREECELGFRDMLAEMAIEIEVVGLHEGMTTNHPMVARPGPCWLLILTWPTSTTSAVRQVRLRGQRRRRGAIDPQAAFPYCPGIFANRRAGRDEMRGVGAHAARSSFERTWRLGDAIENHDRK